LQEIRGKTEGLLAALADFFPPAVERGGGLGRGLSALAESRDEIEARLGGEAEDGFGKVFIDLGCASATLEIVGVERDGGLEIEVSFADKNRAGDDSIDGAENFSKWKVAASQIRVKLSK
jgi:hypothetical protein